jgi:hypothetical protein
MEADFNDREGFGDGFGLGDPYGGYSNDYVCSILRSLHGQLYGMAEAAITPVHTHQALIDAHRNGATIQAYICGDWIEEPNPDWYEDTTYRIKPLHVHQDLMDSYQEGQAWQCTVPSMCGAYADCVSNGAWVEPPWDERVTYRLHPHGTLIQAHNAGAKIQAYVDALDAWVDQANPDWDADVQYRVKPDTNTVYEWMFKPKFNHNWTITTLLMSEEEAKGHFVEYEYRKTGRSWEVEL